MNIICSYIFWKRFKGWKCALCQGQYGIFTFRGTWWCWTLQLCVLGLRPAGPSADSSQHPFSFTSLTKIQLCECEEYQVPVMVWNPYEASGFCFWASSYCQWSIPWVYQTQKWSTPLLPHRTEAWIWRH